MKLSVALCTYNGEKYIESQIDSILNQTLPVDEIVVSDDGSTDSTVALVSDMQKKTSARIVILSNITPLGVNANFSQAINSCTGDIIFLSDQDDIWQNHKVEKIVKWFASHPNKEAVFTNAYFIDSNSKMIHNGLDLFSTVGFTRKAQLYFNHGFALDILLKNDRATGATMALRKSLIPHLDLLQNTGGYHDEIISAKTVQRNTLGFISERLIYYRIHSDQKCGLGNWLFVYPPDSDSVFSPLLTNPRFGSYLYLKSAKLKFDLTKNRDLALTNTGKYMSPWKMHAIDYIEAYRCFGLLLFIRDFMAWTKRRYFENDTISDIGYRMDLF